MTSQNFEFVTNFRDLAIFSIFFSIYKNGETSDVDFLSSLGIRRFFSFPKNFYFLSLLPSFRLKTNQLIKKFSLSDLKFHHKKTQFIKTEASEAVV